MHFGFDEDSECWTCEIDLDMDEFETTGKWSFSQEAGFAWVRTDYAVKSADAENSYATFRYAHHYNWGISAVDGLAFAHNFEFLGSGTPPGCGFLQNLPVLLNKPEIFFVELGKTHIFFIVFWILSLRARRASSFILSMSSVETLCLSTFWKA